MSHNPLPNPISPVSQPISSDSRSSMSLLYLLQLASPALPVGAYSYSEGLELLVDTGYLTTAASLTEWVQQELRYGSMRLDAAIVVRAYRAMIASDGEAIASWNHWLSAIREAKELRHQSWQMGQSLARLVQQLEPDLCPVFAPIENPCNFAIAFGITAAHWQIAPKDAVLGYLHSWMTNLINAGIKLIPLGQTMGQAALIELYPTLYQTVEACLTMADADLYSCGWGSAIASMNHETLYSRLFRS